MSSLTTDIARRYLFGKKSTNSINIITGISILGISIGSAALILILSVFNGFEGLLSGLFNAFNPDIKVVPIEGKYFEASDDLIKKLSEVEGVVAVSRTIEEVALFEYKGIQEIGMIKGVDEAYKDVTHLDSLALDGTYRLKKDNINYGFIGIGLRNKLSINIDDKLTPLTVYMPTKKRKLMGAKEFNSKNIYPAGIFSVKSDSDYQYLLTSLDMVTRLLEKPNQVSALEIKVSNPSNSTNEKLSSLLASNLQVKDRYLQDETFLKVMRIEKWISFLITGLTMLLIAFNLLGALWMIVLDKRKDISVLRALGLNSKDINRLFIKLGLLITVLGIIMGFVIALFLYYLQKEYGLIGVPSGFLMDSYPVKLKGLDFILVTATVLFIGWLASILPAKKASSTFSLLRSK